jgi:N-acetylmuramic acid 6-phosphate (MurNAc-6-P) etherase
MNQPQETPKDHLIAAKDEVKEAALLITDSLKNSADEKIERAKEKIKDAVDKIHDTDDVSAR